MKVEGGYGMAFILTLLLFIACGPQGHLVKSTDLTPKTVSSALPVVPKQKQVDTLSKEEKEYRRQQSEIMREARVAFRQLDAMAAHQNNREEYFKEQRELNKSLIEQQVILFNRALKTRIEKESVDSINIKLLNKLESYDKKLDKYNVQYTKANTLQKQASTEKEWYKWTVLTCVVGTFVFGLISQFRPR